MVSTETSQLEGRSVLRSPETLKLHPVMEELGWTAQVDELNGAARRKAESTPETILVTTNGTILAGFGQWKLALLEHRSQVQCIEYQLGEDESLHFILSRHQPSRGWNLFVRIRLALTLAPYLQQKALENMRAGGKYKGSANLPKAEHIDVRQAIARVAGVGSRNVSNVKTILEKAHPKLIDALQNGILTINRASHWCPLPRLQQVEEFMRYSMENETSKIINHTIARLAIKKTKPDLIAVLDALRQQEARKPGSVVIRPGRHKQTIILVGQEQMRGLHLQTELGEV